MEEEELFIIERMFNSTQCVVLFYKPQLDKDPETSKVEGLAIIKNIKAQNAILVFVYADVVCNLSCLLGVLPMDALNEVYRCIKG